MTPVPDTHTNNIHSNGTDSYFAQTWLVVFLAIFFGAALAIVQVQLSDVIASNKLNETLKQVPRLVLSSPMTTAEIESQNNPIKVLPGVLKIKKDKQNISLPLYRVDQEDDVIGWVVKSSGQGYADKIDLLIGFDAALEIITGIFVLEQKETPGLGNKITRTSWRKQFAGRKTSSPLMLRKNEGKQDSGIDAITGATISSRSVIEIVNRTVEDTRGKFVPDSIRYSERVQ